MTKQIPLDIDEEDFIIKIHPQRDSNNNWTGDVKLGIITSHDNPLTDNDFFYMMEFTNLICATVPMMSEDPDFREEIQAFVDAEREEEKAKQIANLRKKPNKNKVTETTGNVIKVAFSDKIDGSA